MNLIVKEPETEEDFKRYYELRWQILRKPWNQPRGSEKDELENSSIHIMVCDEEDNLLAVGRAHYNTAEEAQIRYMAVDYMWQGKGIGKTVLDEFEKRIISSGCKKIILHARDNAVKFYERNGYRIVKQSHTLFSVIPHFLMEKSLKM